MKQLKGKKYFYPVVITGAVVIALIVLRLLGFRITYTEPNWDALSSWASWASVGASFIAIWFAIQVPKKIAARQDKITLFEKRFDCYMAVQQTLEISNSIKDVTDSNKAQFAFELVISIQHPENYNKNVPLSILSYFRYLERLVMSGQFLFENYDCTDIQSALNEMVKFVLVMYSPVRASPNLTNEEIQQKNNICQICEQFRDKYLLSMENELNLKK